MHRPVFFLTKWRNILIGREYDRRKLTMEEAGKLRSLTQPARISDYTGSPELTRDAMSREHGIAPASVTQDSIAPSAAVSGFLFFGLAGPAEGFSTEHDAFGAPGTHDLRAPVDQSRVPATVIPVHRNRAHSGCRCRCLPTVASDRAPGSNSPVVALARGQAVFSKTTNLGGQRHDLDRQTQALDQQTIRRLHVCRR